MTAVLICALAGLVPLLWPARGRRSAPSAPVGQPASTWSGAGAGRRDSPSWLGAGRGRSWLRAGRGHREDYSDDVADALVLVAWGLRAGLPLTAALQHVCETASGTVRGDLAAVVAALRWGLPAQQAWAYAGPNWRAAATATHLSEQTGAAAAEVLEEAATRMREQGERARERAAARAGVLLVLPLGLGFLPAFACTAVVPLVAILADGVLTGGS